VHFALHGRDLAHDTHVFDLRRSGGLEAPAGLRLGCCPAPAHGLPRSLELPLAAQCTIVDLPDLINFVLTEWPIVFVRVDAALVEYAVVDSRTVGEAKAELGLRALLQND
jgi:hypothetical protein